MVLMRCAQSSPSLPDGLEEGRLHARPDSAGTASASVRPGVQRLGLSAGRDGYFYVPRGSAAVAAAPLLLYLHGAGGNAGRAIQRLLEHSDRTGTIVLVPESRLTTWGFSGRDQAADLAFIDDALEKLFESHRIDPRRIDVAGFSDGASAALSWGLMNGDLFSAIAAFSPGFVHLSSPARGNPRIFISHGTDDSILPIDRCGRRIARELRAAGCRVDYREFEGDHTVPPQILQAGLDSLLQTLA